MNKFLAKSKKKPEDGPTSPTIGAPPASKKRFGRKKQEPERKPEFDLSAALPSSDNFRTSLLMPGLSTRFSMLREQDDPRSMLGKASDDSVLAPRRRSRLADFSNLGDIAEVDSIRGSFRPPFASDSRTLSYHTDPEMTTDDDASYSGSIMSRARPGEGNVLFGGRQKIFKIPVGDAGSVSNLGSKESRGMRGRALYEDDVHVSAFQKYREQARLAERERRLADLDRELQFDDLRKDSPHSPALSAYDEKRATTSSTNSGPSMSSAISTAPTSIISQPSAQGLTSPNLPSPSTATGGLQRSNSRRLYEQGLDQHLSEQQNAALTRLNSLTRKGSNNGRPKLSQSRSASNIRERYEASPAGSARAASPLSPPTEKMAAFESVPASKPGEILPAGSFNFGFNDPENPLALAVDRNDRGKATALGQFNRPKQFDEEQFLSRQRSLLQQRNGSRTRRPTGSQSPSKPDSGAPSPLPSGQTSASGSRRPSGEGRPLNSASGTPVGQRSRSGTVQAEAVRPLGPPRTRAGTIQNDRHFSRPYSPSAEAAASAAQNSKLTLMTHPPRKQSNPQPLQSPALPQSATLPRMPPMRSIDATAQPQVEPLGKPSIERAMAAEGRSPLQASPPPIQEHPAMRIGSPTRSSADKRRGWSPEDLAGKFTPPPTTTDFESTIPSIGIDESAAQEPNITSAPQSLRLGGFVREHLRQISNVSSIYDIDESRELAPEYLDRGTSLLFSPSAGPWATSTAPDASRTEEAPKLSPAQQSYHDDDDDATPQPQENPYTASSQQHFEQTHEPVPQPEPLRVGLTKDPQNLKASDAAQWMAELKKQQQQQHTREASTETEYERRAFAEDLRQRQRRIQENLKFRNDNERTTSPGPNNSSRSAHETSFKPFGLMRKPSSKENMRQDSPVKGRNGGAQPIGRTLHMKMSGGDDDGFEISAQETSRYRQGSHAYHASPTASSRPSTSPNDSSMTRSSTASGQSGRTDEDKDASMDIHRKDFPAPFQTARPSADFARGRASSSDGPRPPMAPNGAVPPLPRAAAHGLPASGSLAASSTSVTSPMSSGKETPTISATSSVSDIRSQAAFQPPAPLKSSRSASPIVPSANTFSFPVRTPSERPAAMSSSANRRRSPSVKKGDISHPTLISSTSTFDTVGLAEKRAALANGGRGKVAAAAAEINATSASTGETLQVTNPAGQPPSVPPMSPMRRGFFNRRNPDADEGEDEFINKPSGGRLRIRKVSDENGFGRRHEAAPAGMVETNERGPQGGMF